MDVNDIELYIAVMAHYLNIDNKAAVKYFIKIQYHSSKMNEIISSVSVFIMKEIQN